MSCYADAYLQKLAALAFNQGIKFFLKVQDLDFEIAGSGYWGVVDAPGPRVSLKHVCNGGKKGQLGPKLVAVVPIAVRDLWPLLSTDRVHPKNSLVRT